jgi:hypothetical protein
MKSSSMACPNKTGTKHDFATCDTKMNKGVIFFNNR